MRTTSRVLGHLDISYVDRSSKIQSRENTCRVSLKNIRGKDKIKPAV